ncbi:MAG: class I SAM-dependent methyltransferase [bacterium]|nr:class I SAM-dependent methyltransferase [bacterium]
MELDASLRLRLAQALGQAQKRGWVGKKQLDSYIDHSLGFARVMHLVPEVAVDLGSGGGLPALVLMAVWPKCRWTLVEVSLARAALLELNCVRLGWADRVEVCHADAHSLIGDVGFVGCADLVTARSFGPAETVVAAAAPLLRQGGELIVSAAPDADPWSDVMLVAHGLAPDQVTSTKPRFHHTRKL